MPTKQKPKLLVVDDERENLDLMYRTFRREFQVFRAESPAVAIDILSTQGEMAVIISDQSMPEMTGIEFLSKTVELYPQTIRILLTGYAAEELNPEETTHIFKLISKPWNPEELKSTIKHAAVVYQENKAHDDP
ncbi:MAG: response regulator [Microcoleaceae cyanobacterium]